MNPDYSLADSYYHPGGGDDKLYPAVKSKVNGLAQSLVGKHVVGSFLLICLLLVVVWWLWRNEKLTNPTQLMKASDSDQFGFGREGLAADRSGSYFSTYAQDNAGIPNIKFNPNAAPGAPNSYNWAILNSPDFNCSGRVPVEADAWGWMNTALHSSEGMDVGKATDNSLTKVMAGY